MDKRMDAVKAMLILAALLAAYAVVGRLDYADEVRVSAMVAEQRMRLAECHAEGGRVLVDGRCVVGWRDE